MASGEELSQPPDGLIELHSRHGSLSLGRITASVCSRSSFAEQDQNEIGSKMKTSCTNQRVPTRDGHLLGVEPGPLVGDNLLDP